MRIEELKTELTDDSLGRGYSGMTDAEAADSLNTVNRDRNRTSMTGGEVFEEIDQTEFNGKTDPQKAQVLALCGIGDLNPYGNAAALLISIFSGGSDTIIALQAARVEQVSRGVELGLGIVREGHIQQARA